MAKKLAMAPTPLSHTIRLKYPMAQPTGISVPSAEKLETGSGAHGISVSEDGTLIAVRNTYAATVSIVDAAAAKVLASIPVGAGPNGVTMLRTIAR